MNRASVDCWVDRVAVASDGHLAAVVDDSSLAPAERARAEGIAALAARARYVAGRILLRRVLGGMLGVPPSEVPLSGGGGRVRVEVDDCFVSISHADSFVAVAVSSAGPVGVDVETADRAADRVPAIALSPQKLEAVSSLVEPRLAPVGVWVAQEAAVKADGIGLAYPLADVAIDPSAEGLVVRLGERSVWGVRLRTVEKAIVGVAGVGPPPEVVWRDGRGRPI